MSGARVSAAQAVEQIQRGATVFLEQGACEPTLLHQALLFGNCEAQLLAAPVNGLNRCEFGEARFAPRLNPIVFVSAPELADAIHAGRVSYLPLHWSEVMGAIRARFRPDVALIQVSPPDENGFCSLGGNAAFELEVAELARMVIAEVNPNVPRVSGDTALHESRIAYWVESDVPLRAMPPTAWGPLESEIAGYVDSLIPDSCTLQIGPGKVPDAVLDRLARAGKHVRFHSGILTDAMLRVAEAQTTHRDDIAVAGMLLGSAQLYRAVDRNPRVSLRNTAHTHSLAVMGAIDRFISVNSAIEVDLMGQVNAECVKGRQVSGVGGQVDFFRGALASSGGLAILAMPSSTSSRSRIVPGFPAGTPVSTSRMDLDYIVTEYGVAAMRNRTEGERAQALIAISAPKYRNELRSALVRHFSGHTGDKIC
jgi:4-hydroxybutyrate CoA-transferase